jgi:DeoR family fructose operon transcriptional repressor
MMACGQEVIIVADHTKFGRLALARLCGLDEVGRVISDPALGDQYREILSAAGVALQIARDPSDAKANGRSQNGDSVGPERALGMGRPA